MKKLFFVFLLFLQSLYSISQVKTEVSIDCKLVGTQIFTVANLNDMSSGRPQFMSTSPIAKEGTFHFQTQAISKTDVYQIELRSTSMRKIVLLVLSPGDKVDLTLSYEGGEVGITSVSGSDEIQILKTFADMYNDMQNKVAEYQNKYNAANTDEQRGLINREFNEMYISSMNANVQYLYNNSDHIASLLTAYSYFENDFDSQPIRLLFQNLYDNLKAKYADNILIQVVGYKLSNPITVGKEAPAIEGTSPDGRVLKLSDLRGKVVLIDFWASWCRPCRAENPNVVQAYNKYHDKGFEVFSVSLDSDLSMWKNAIAADGLIWSNHICSFRKWSCPIAQAYRVSSIPFSVLIDKEGKIVATGLRGDKLQQALSQLLD